MSELLTISPERLQSYLSKRKGETKLGENIQICTENWTDELTQDSIKYVLFGIPEDIGPRANFGNGGAQNAWDAFLKKFLNMQSNRFYRGDNLLLLGEINCTNLMTRSNELDASKQTDLTQLRQLVSELDDKVYRVCKLIHEAGKIPIVIGGGHNNSYGLIKGASLAHNKAINCINLDPHADYRALEGRHSGNGFSYAKTEGLLDHYFVLALHEIYNSEHILERVPDKFDYTSHEAILRKEISFDEALDRALSRFGKTPCGIELDLDSIENVATSAITPCGISTTQARQYVLECAKRLNPAYLHLAEGAPRNDQEMNAVGKLLAYLVIDFLKS